MAQSWEDFIQGLGRSAVDFYVTKEQADQTNDAAYEIERLRLLQRNPQGAAYIEGLPGFSGGYGTAAQPGFMSSTAGKLALVAGAGLVLWLALRKG